MELEVLSRLVLNFQREVVGRICAEDAYNNNRDGSSTQKAVRRFRGDLSPFQVTARCSGLKYALLLRQKWRR